MITIRKAIKSDTKKIAKIIDKTWKISYKDIIPNDILTKRTHQHLIPQIKNDIGSNNKIVLVATTSSNKIVGMVSGGICRKRTKNYTGELYAIYVLPKYQQKSIGKLLFMNFCTWMKEHGFNSITLWALKTNKPTRIFYKKIGGRAIREKKIEIGDKKFGVVAYGWPELRTHNLGKEPINLAKHNSQWPNKAKLEIAHIKSTLKNNLITDIQHIGSTAIPHIKSKPVIDIMVGVTSFNHKKENLIKPLGTIGYVLCKNNPDKERLFFVKGLPPFGKKRTHHTHIAKYKSKTWNQHIFFRDYLIKHPAIAKKYEALKIRLAKKYQTNREKYTQKKKDFIKNILQKNKQKHT